jgi:Mg2+/Co2+ transporter CorC
MYWAIESVTVANFISGDLPNEFDQDDKDDLAGMAAGTIEVSSQI